jgi:hypothetical protein
MHYIILTAIGSKNYFKALCILARHWCLLPIMLVYLGGRDQFQPKEIIHGDLISKMPNTQKGLVKWLKW